MKAAPHTCGFGKKALSGGAITYSVSSFHDQSHATFQCSCAGVDPIVTQAGKDRGKLEGLSRSSSPA